MTPEPKQEEDPNSFAAGLRTGYEITNAHLSAQQKRSAKEAIHTTVPIGLALFLLGMVGGNSWHKNDVQKLLNDPKALSATLDGFETPDQALATLQEKGIDLKDPNVAESLKLIESFAARIAAKEDEKARSR